MNLVNIPEKIFLNQNADIPDNQKILPTDINQIVNAINNLIYPVGIYIETSDTTFDPNVSWGGTWVKDSAGLVTVSQKIGDSDFGTVGKTGGEKTHTLTIEEIPSHNHAIKRGTSADSYFGFTSKETQNPTYEGTTESTGGGQAHNNLPPYKVVIRWHRTA